MTQESIAHWDANQVMSFSETVTAEESLAALEWRNSLYPGLLTLMPVDLPGKTVIDFGCGPGHDTIGFLLHGAAHVYAVDASWNGLGFTRARLRAHGLEDRCTLVLVGEGDWRLPTVDHIHAAGVIHHLADPAAALRKLSYSLGEGAEIRMMVYSAESEYVAAVGGPEAFELITDHGAPIAKAWTDEEVQELAAAAGLSADYVGRYLTPAEKDGPGLSACYSLVLAKAAEVKS